MLKANLEAMNSISPEHCWNDAHDVTVQVITAGLLELGLLQGELDDLIKNEAYKPFLYAPRWALAGLRRA